MSVLAWQEYVLSDTEYLTVTKSSDFFAREISQKANKKAIGQRSAVLSPVELIDQGDTFNHNPIRSTSSTSNRFKATQLLCFFRLSSILFNKTDVDLGAQRGPLLNRKDKLRINQTASTTLC